MHHRRNLELTPDKIVGTLIGNQSWGWQSADPSDICFADFRHCTQVFDQMNQTSNYTCATDLPFKRSLARCDPEEAYQPRKGEERSVVHWGQRKLLLSEVEFLTSCLLRGPDTIVVYAGAAPGTHMKELCDLFPETKFVLIDPAPFSINPERDSGLQHVILRQEMMTDALASEFASKSGSVLFISDVRSADFNRMSEQENEEQIAKDMSDQMRWHLLMKPVRSMLKFRLPWASGTTEYLAGSVMLPIFGPTATT